MIQDFIKDQRGAVAIVSIISFGVIAASSLFAIDLVRHNVAQTRLQNALDATVISSGRKLSDFNPEISSEDNKWRQDAKNYFSANMPQGYLGVEIPDNALKIEYKPDKSGKFVKSQLIEMSVDLDLPLLSTGYFQQTAWPLGAANTAQRKVRNDLELVLALDNSGSMDDSAGKSLGTRMKVLKDSTKDLIEMVMEAAALGQEDQVDDGEVRGAYIGLVPFNDVVNVGDINSARSSWMANWLSRFPEQQNYLNNNWGGCIVEPAGNWTTSNRLPPLALNPQAGFQPLVSIYSASVDPVSSDSKKRLVKNTAYPNGVGFLQSDAKNDTSPSYDRRVNADFIGTNGPIYTRFAVEPDYCARSKVKFFVGGQEEQKNKTLTNAVNSMVSYGGTNVGMGLLWAWRMLDPAWRGGSGWGNPGLPRDYETDKLNKVIVLLSDGDNAPSGVVQRRSVKSGKAAYKLAYAYQQGTETCTGSGRNKSCKTTWNSKVNTDMQTYSISAINVFNQCPVSGLRIVDPNDITPSNYNSACTKAKTDIGWAGPNPGNTAITVAAMDNFMAQLCTNIKDKGIRIFTLTLSSDVKNKSLMQNCATGENYFDVTDASKLPDAFAQIAGALTELRLIN